MSTGEHGSGGLVLVPDSALTPVGEPVRRLVAGWLLGFASVHTRRAYSGDIAGWLAFCTDYSVDPLTASRTHVDAWARSLEAAGLRPRTIARHHRVVYCVPAHRRDQHPQRHLIRPHHRTIAHDRRPCQPHRRK